MGKHSIICNFYFFLFSYWLASQFVVLLPQSYLSFYNGVEWIFRSNTCLMDTLMSLNFPLNNSNSPLEIGVLCLTFLHFSSLTKLFLHQRSLLKLVGWSGFEPLSICNWFYALTKGHHTNTIDLINLPINVPSLQCINGW